MRASFINSCDLYAGPGAIAPGLYSANVPCRLVDEDGITPIGTGSPDIPAYLLCDAELPVGAWLTGADFGLDPQLADQIAIPSGSAVSYWVVYVDKIDWQGQPIYYRSYLSPLPLPSSPLSVVYVYDSFTNADNTVVTSRSPDVGTTPTSGSGNYKVFTNAAMNKVDGLSYSPMVYESGHADCTVKANITNAITSTFGPTSFDLGRLVWRYLDDNNYWELDILGGSVRAILHSSGVVTVPHSGSFSAVDNVTYEYKMVLLGSACQFFVNGSSVMSFTNSTHSTRTKHGLVFTFYSGTGASKADDFKVTN